LTGWLLPGSGDEMDLLTRGRGRIGSRPASDRGFRRRSVGRRCAGISPSAEFTN